MGSEPQDTASLTTIDDLPNDARFYDRDGCPGVSYYDITYSDAAAFLPEQYFAPLFNEVATTHWNDEQIHGKLYFKDSALVSDEGLTERSLQAGPVLVALPYHRWSEREGIDFLSYSPLLRSRLSDIIHADECLPAEPVVPIYTPSLVTFTGNTTPVADVRTVRMKYNPCPPGLFLDVHNGKYLMVSMDENSPLGMLQSSSDIESKLVGHVESRKTVKQQGEAWLQFLRTEPHAAAGEQPVVAVLKRIISVWREDTEGKLSIPFHRAQSWDWGLPLKDQ